MERSGTAASTPELPALAPVVALPSAQESEGGEMDAEQAHGWPPELVALYRERRLTLTRIAYLLTSDAEVAEEIVHDAVIATRARWPDVHDPPAYLRTAVVNRSRSWLRRRRTATQNPPEAIPPVEMEADELWDALATLSERRRTAIVLRFYEDLPDHEIAAVLGCRPATVRTLIHRGLALLRKEIDR